MLEKFLNKKVEIFVSSYGTPYVSLVNTYSIKYQGVVTNVDSNFIELNNNRVIQIKYIISIMNIK